MALTVKQMKQILKNRADINLTLANDHDETWSLGYATDVLPHNHSIKFKWPVENQPQNAYPFDKAILWNGGGVITGFSVTPLDPAQQGKYIELSYDYE